MRALIVFLLSCATVLGADSELRVVATVRTNDSGRVSTKEVFTRGGQTNLVRNTATKGGVVQIRIHRFYHDGSLVGDFVAMRDSSGFTTEAGTPYSVSFECDASHKPKSVVIGTKDGVILDAFSYTNGIFSPVESSVLEKGNAVGADMKKLFDPEHVRKITPEGFVSEAQQLIEKHKDKDSK
jgi:hypothetical protein